MRMLASCSLPRQLDQVTTSALTCAYRDRCCQNPRRGARALICTVRKLAGKPTECDVLELQWKKKKQPIVIASIVTGCAARP